MEMENRGDIRIAGMGTATGGVYNQVKIEGHGKITGDVECSDYICMGNSTVKGNLKAKSVKVHGASQFSGNLDVDKLVVKGQASIEGKVVSKEAKFEGNATITGDLTGEEIKVEGTILTEGDCESEQFKVKGAFTIAGLLNAGNIDITMYGECKVKEIGGETIHIRKTGMSYLNKLFRSLFTTRLVTDVIEGDDIYVERTNAKVLRGNSVKIGPDCEIDLVEYRTSLEIDSTAKVKESVQL